MNNQGILTEYLAAFITGLIHAGVGDVVISPGSRSTPLAMLMAEHEEMNTIINIDERSAGFFALGMAKASRKPVALLCTSGTAAANYYPAIIEASLSRVPLIVLTADRPHELRDIGAPQAINQIHLYGEHVRWFAEMALPESGQENYAKTAGVRAVKEAMGQLKGPVHLNFPFREPLIPLLDPYPFKREESAISIENGHLTAPSETFEKLAQEWQAVKRGLIICGPIDEPSFSEAVQTLAFKLGFPILADPLSQLRSSSSTESMVIDSYDAILKSEAADFLKPELIIRFGGMPVSKPLSLFVKKLRNVEHVIIDSGSGWRDPHNVGTKMVYCEETVFCTEMAKRINERKTSLWSSIWHDMDSITKDVISEHIVREEGLDEGKAVYELAGLLPEQSTIFVGNSMPIRDLDTFFHKTNKNVRIMGNRGANGIDGVVSTALGASVYERPLFLVIGDLSFFHDMNGLLAAKLHKLNVTIILLNNDGGGIFSYLPQAEEPKHFEVLFGTPTGLNYEHAVRMYHGQYTRVFDWEGYRMAVMDAVSYDGLNVIEVPTDREKNIVSHRAMWERVSREINKYLQGVEKC